MLCNDGELWIRALIAPSPLWPCHEPCCSVVQIAPSNFSVQIQAGILMKWRETDLHLLCRFVNLHRSSAVPCWPSPSLVGGLNGEMAGGPRGGTLVSAEALRLCSDGGRWRLGRRGWE